MLRGASTRLSMPCYDDSLCSVACPGRRNGYAIVLYDSPTRSMMEQPATIKLHLPNGEATRLRIAEILNWSGIGIAAPRTDLQEFLERAEVERSGVYFLLGTETGTPLAYIGEAEVVRDRIRQHKEKAFWVTVIALVSKDENLTKAHIRFLEGRIMAEARHIGRYQLDNENVPETRLPESDRKDMEVFLGHVRRILPVLGSDILTPVSGTRGTQSVLPLLLCAVRGAKAKGRRTEAGFVVYSGSTAVLKERPSARNYGSWLTDIRKQLLANGTLVAKDSYYLFTRDAEFKSPSTAASVIHGGHANGLIAWKTGDGTTLRAIEES